MKIPHAKPGDVIAVVALVVSLGTFYYTTWWEGTFKMGMGPMIMMQIQDNGRLAFYPEIILEDPGALSALVDHVDCSLGPADDPGQSLEWTQNVTTTYNEGKNQPNTHFDSWPGALVVTKDGAMSKRMMFVTATSLLPQVGTYQLTLNANHNGKAAGPITAVLLLRDEDVDFLLKHQAGSGKTEMWGLYLHRDGGKEVYRHAE
jgi:hypothetical protein